jgi:hypothetical protein
MRCWANYDDPRSGIDLFVELNPIEQFGIVALHTLR